MGGGLIQLVAYGAQDIYLTGEPQITFVKSVYLRHSNFALESIEITFSDIVKVNTRISILIPRNGDLLKRLWIEYNPSLLLSGSIEQNINNKRILNTIGSDFSHALIDQVEIEIGGVVIDRHYGKWLSIWRDLTQVNPYALQSSLSLRGSENTGELGTLYDQMAFTHKGVCSSTNVNPNILLSGGVSTENTPTTAYIPLQFWFCKNPGLAIPLISLQYSDVRLNINLSNFPSFLCRSLYTPFTINEYINLDSFKIFGDYVYLDSLERTKFVQNTHEYLIEQLQVQNTSGLKNIKLNFKQMVKELIITGNPEPTSTFFIPGEAAQPTNIKDHTSFLYLTDGEATPRPIVIRDGTGYYDIETLANNSGVDASSTTNVKLQLVINGKDQFTPKNLKYFTRNQIYDHHTGNPGTYGTIGVYSFALHPEEHQPSGACNFSRIDDCRLIFTGFDDSVNERLNPLDVYATTYNILNITSGMGGVVYSN